MAPSDEELQALKANAPSLQVRSLSEQDLQKELARALDSTESTKQIVQSDDQLKSDKTPDNTAEKVFLSKHNQVIDANTRAARVGTFKNVLKEGVTQSPSKTHSQAPTTLKNLMTLTPDALDLEQDERLKVKTGRLKNRDEAKTGRKPASVAGPESPDAAQVGEGFSATDDYLEDIAIGANTLLNAREFKFYSFYERIREKLSTAWRSQLTRQLESIFARGENLGFDRKTKVEVQLDARGQLQAVRIIGASGFIELDRAATDAFKSAAPFPNPPLGMIDGEQRHVSLRWDFVVMADMEQPRIKMEVRRNPAGGY